MAAPTYTLRPLERRIPNSSIEGGFRVHLLSRELQKLGLAAGDLVRLSNISGATGFAVAWPFTETNPGTKPIAKVTELWRDTYGFTLLEKVSIEKANQPWRTVDTVTVSLSDPSQPLGGYESPEELEDWAKYALVEIDMLFPGCTFEVQRRGAKHRTNPARIRLVIDNVEPAPDSSGPVYFELSKSKVSLINAPSIVKQPSQQSLVLHLASEGIGGLSEHIEAINYYLTCLSDPAFVLDDHHLIGPSSVLLHGPEGTGKSLLLERLGQCPWREVIKLDLDWLTAHSKAPSKAMSDVFDKARNSQPSLLIIDDLDKFLSKTEATCGRLKEELKKLEGSRVFVAAAARSIYDIDTSLRTPSAFKTELEIFPPNVKQREDILRQILGTKRNVPDVDYTVLAEKSHGFVGRDINKLCSLARNHRVQSTYQSLEAEKRSSFAEIVNGMEFVTQADFDAVIDEVQPTVLKDSVLEVPKVRWTDIAGVDHVRKILEAITVRPFKYPDLDTKFGGPQSRKGVLMYGPPGCAKTLIAQAVATESNQNFLAVKGSELIKMYVGESERAIRDVFRRARTAKPCIIFFDEIDSIGKSREKSQDSGLNVVTTLLNEMDGIEALKDVFIIGATNRPDILDSALIRTGRFDAHIHIGLPTPEARRQIFEIHTRKRPLAADVDLDFLASQTEGSSGADIKGLCAVAVEAAISDYEQNPEGQPEIRMSHFEQALEVHVPHTIKEEAARYENWRPGLSLSSE
ncbi:cell division cycle protein 48 [Delitschia confertaspora ATCC 74209]|uniref:Cell division cycle protein 48 n=1 Tax=Delitschia confertaspora ATCC 74209 TaxID=1513339 RepID=A0A9P4JTF4_9PLEO|nr:cell division cycle protein 48 [Delitschia confertaspora ATCC 74209]